MKKSEVKRLGYFVLFLLVQALWIGIGSLASPAPSNSATPANTPSGEVSADPQKPKQ